MEDYKQHLESALSAIKVLKADLVAARKDHQDPIAIVGLNFRFPGADSIKAFWQNLRNKNDLITEVPFERWDWRAIFDEKEGHDTTQCNQGGFINDVDKFDPLFFGISPKEAKFMDPQQRLALESSWRCVEDAGYKISELAGSNTGVYYAISKSDYEELLYKSGIATEAVTSTGVASSIIANRISFLFKLNGPSFPIDTACSGSLIALHTAVKAIQNGDCEAALVGGVNLMLTPTLTVSFDKAGMLSPDCRSKAFDVNANGYARGEGVATLMLKPLKSAEKDGDHIYGVIKGTAINHGGQANSLTAPNAESQKKLIVKAVTSAGVAPGTITYIEAHGTGTKLGDPIEINGIQAAFQELEGSASYSEAKCAIGSVKTNIGHLEAAAGLAGIIKVLIAMRNGLIPGNPHLKEVNPYISLDGSRFEIARDNQKWENLVDGNGKVIPLRAGISSFGFGGAYGHAVVEQYIPVKTEINKTDAAFLPLFCLSARDTEALSRYLSNVRSYLKDFLSNQLTNAEVTSMLTQAVAAIIKSAPEDINQQIDLETLGVNGEDFRLLCETIRAEFQLANPTDNFHRSLSISELSDLIYKTCRSSRQILENEKRLGEILPRILYTTQVGREHFSYRFAVVCRSLNDLYESIDSALTTPSKMHPDISSGSVCMPLSLNEPSELELSAHQLGLSWIKNEKVEFGKFYGAKKPKKIPIPTYPFARNRYWFPKLDQLKTGEVNNSLHYKNSSEKSSIPDKPVGKTALETVGLQIINENIALVKLNSSDGSNMFTDDFLVGIEARFQQINENQSLKVVVIHGHERVFSMGGTKDWLFGIARGNRSFTDAPFLFEGLLNCNLPVISAIEGHAFGGGLLFGLYADIPVLSMSSLYSANFMQYGFTPGMGATLLLGEKLGNSLASEMMFSARSYKGSELKDRGAAIAIVDHNQVLDYALRLAGDLCQSPRNSLIALKSAISRRFLSKLHPIIDEEARMHAGVVRSEQVLSLLQQHFESVDAPVAAKKVLVNPIAGTVANFVAAKLSLKVEASTYSDKVPVDAKTKKKIKLSTVQEGTFPENQDSSLDHIKQNLISIVAQILHLDAADIDDETHLVNFGLDSISGLDLIKGIKVKLGLTINMEIIYQYKNVSGIAAYLTGHTPAIKEFGDVVARLSNVVLAQDDFSIKRPSEKDEQIISIQARQVIADQVTKTAGHGEPIDRDAALPKVTSCLSKVLHLDSVDFEATTSLKDLGLDSISSLEFSRELSRAFQVHISTGEIHQLGSCLAIAQQLGEQKGTTPAADMHEMLQKNPDDLDDILAGVLSGLIDVDEAAEQI